MFSLTYDLWKEIIEEIALAHHSLFSAMHQAAEELPLSKALIDDLKKKRELPLADNPFELRLTIEFIEDEINGFIIYLEAIEPLEILEDIKANVASDHGFSLEEIVGFELEHGLDMQEELFEEMEECYEVRAEVRENSVIYVLVIFDSQDIDNSLSSDLTWQEDHEN